MFLYATEAQQQAITLLKLKILLRSLQSVVMGSRLGHISSSSSAD